MVDKKITLTPEWLAEAKKAHADALKQGRSRNDVIQFQGNEFVVSYLGYLIEYAESIFGKKEN